MITKQKRIWLLRLLFFIAVGIAAISLGKAATQTISIEPEKGTFSTSGSGDATRVPTPGSSANYATRFGQTPPNPNNTLMRWDTATAFENPIHFSDTYIDPPGRFNRIEVDTTIEISSGSDGYFYSNFLFFPDMPSCSPDCYAYMGLQTVGGKDLPPGGNVDKMLIFSVWNSTNSVPNPGVTPVNFDGEGVGRSLRLAYDWKVGRTYRLILNYNSTISTATTHFWSASVLDLGNGQQTSLGSIQMPGQMTVAQSSALFHERYSGQTSSCATMNPSQVKFSKIRAYIPDTNSWAAMNAWTTYQANVTGCNGNFWAKDLPGAALRSGINTPVQ